MIRDLNNIINMLDDVSRQYKLSYKLLKNLDFFFFLSAQMAKKTGLSCLTTGTFSPKIS